MDGVVHIGRDDIKGIKGFWLVKSKGKLLEIEIPDVPARNCAGFAKRIAADAFGNFYMRSTDQGEGDAWNLRYFHKTIQIDGHFSYQSMVPGHLIGIRRAFSLFREGLDIKGNQRAYTHIAVVLREGDYKTLLMAEQLIAKTSLTTPERIEQRGDELVEMVLPGRI